MKQYYIEAEHLNEYRIVDLEYDPTGTMLGNKITYPEPSIFSTVIIEDNLYNAFQKGVEIIHTQQDIHYEKIKGA